jgi:hypothetical protein
MILTRCFVTIVVLLSAIGAATSNPNRATAGEVNPYLYLDGGRLADVLAPHMVSSRPSQRIEISLADMLSKLYKGEPMFLTDHVYVGKVVRTRAA